MYEEGNYRVKKQRFFCFYRLRIYKKVRMLNKNHNWIGTKYDIVYSEITRADHVVEILNNGYRILKNVTPRGVDVC